MEQLVEKTNKLLATSFMMYLNAHQFHWNVEGQDFHQYHAFLGDLYEELWGSVDTTAEQIRALGGYANGSIAAFREASTVRDQITIVTDVQDINRILLRANDGVLVVLNEVHEEATGQKAYGLINYVEGRIDIHNKHGWMLRASLQKRDEPQVENEEHQQLDTAQLAESVSPVAHEEQTLVYALNPSDM